MLSEKKFSKECVRVCVKVSILNTRDYGVGGEDDGDEHDDELDRDLKETRQMENIEELLDFFLVANDETRRNVTGLMKVHTLSLFILKNYLTMYVILDTI